MNAARNICFKTIFTLKKCVFTGLLDNLVAQIGDINILRNLVTANYIISSFGGNFKVGSLRNRGALSLHT